jgi:hypothetical protein
MSTYYDRAIQLYDKAERNGDEEGMRATAIARIIIEEFELDSNFDTVRKNIYNLIRRERMGITQGKNKPGYVKRTDECEKKSEARPFVLSAWNEDTGKMMDIHSYCDHYGLPYADMVDHKLVTHTGTPYYNIKWKNNNGVEPVDVLAVIDEHIKANYGTVVCSSNPDLEGVVDRLIWTDVHIGMEPNPNGLSLYGGKWDKEEVQKRIDHVVMEVIYNRQGNTLIIDELGDFMDGWDGETVRKGHSLPQNMTNEEAFDTALFAKTYMVEALAKEYDHVICNNICEDNHAGSFGYVVNSAFKHICNAKYPNVNVHNHRKFMSWYTVGKHAFVITHGKDSKNLKFGFKPKLDPVQIEKIDQFLKQEGIYKLADYIQFDKGDSHQCLFDHCSSDDFDYMNYPAFSPSSDWVQTNFKKGRSGFVLQWIYPDQNRKPYEVFWF